MEDIEMETIKVQSWYAKQEGFGSSKIKVRFIRESEKAILFESFIKGKWVEKWIPKSLIVKERLDKNQLLF